MTASKLHLEVVEPIINYEIHLAEDPIREIWHDILFYSDPSILRQYWKFNDLTDDLLSYVTTSLKQADEYYRASQTVSIHTRPLLLYYSALNLTKATLTILNNRQCGAYHGLSGFKTNDDLSALSANTCEGVFTELADKLKAPWALKHGKNFSFELLASNCVDIASHYCPHYGRPTKIIAAKIFRKTDGTITLTFGENEITSDPATQTLFDNHAKLNSMFIKDPSSSAPGKIIYKNKDVIPMGYNEMRKHGNPLLADLFQFGLRNENPRIGYLALEPPQDIIPQPVCYLGLLFLLGSAVRYAPASLTKWLHDPMQSRTWLLDKVCSLAARLYPNYMLNLLRDKDLRYSPSF